MTKKRIFITLTATIIALTAAGCNDTPIGTDKGGAADTFLAAFNNDKDGATYALEITISPPDKGSVSQLPESADRLYADGTQVSLKATPVEFTYVFSHWSGDGLPQDVNSTSDAISVTMNANRSLTANFALHPLILGGNRAWAESSERKEGLILKEDKTFTGISRPNTSANVWNIEYSGKWSLTGNQLIFEYDGGHGTENFIYEIISNNLMLIAEGSSQSTTYTVTNGVNVNP
jgi:hypothetical protein